MAFTLLPTTEVFNQCRKKYLLLIAEFFNVIVNKDATKQVIKEKLYEELVSTGILPAESPLDVLEENVGEKLLLQVYPFLLNLD